MCGKRFLIILSLALILLCGVVVVVALISIEQEKSKIRDKFGKEVAEMCDEPGGGEASLDNLTNPDGQLRVLVLTDGGLYHEWHDQLPAEMRASNRASLDAVVCVQKYTKSLEKCPYVNEQDDNKTQFTIERVQPMMDVILLNPETGARIAEITVQGGVPDECPDEARGSKGGTTQQKGKEITYNDFYTALTEFSG